MKKLIALMPLLLLFVASAIGQNRKMNFMDPNENFYSTQKRLNKHFRKHEREEQRERKEREGKGLVAEWEEQELAGYELYKRWEYYMQPRVYPSGDKSQAYRAMEEYQSYLLQRQQERQSSNNSVQSSTWQPLGPFGDPTNGGNAGRINAVRTSPTSTTGLWACAPDGGLWSTNNSGSTWSTNTDNLSLIGSSDVVFDPTNSQVMYLATGDGDAGDSKSIGVLKSTDGGTTWNATGMVWTPSQSRVIYKLMINPQNKNVVFAASNVGLYRTTNGGSSWSVVQSGSFTDIEYKPGDTTTVYGVTTSMYGVGTTSFYRSTNGGASFTAITSGLPASSANTRLAIAVTAANSAYVYLVCALASNDGFGGFYRSTNSGTSFTGMLTASTPNLLGWASNGSDASAGGQGWYTLSIAASPTNANEVCVGGVNIWRTTDGGSNWSLFAHWTGSGAPYVHADIHFLEYKNGTTIYVGCDGGAFVTTNSGSSFSAINGNMNIAQEYKIGNSASTYSLVISGHQDNGTNIYTGGWNRTMGGDGMSAFIDWSNNSVMYGEQYQGSFNRSTNGGASWTGITSGMTGTGAWNTPWHQDPNTANTLWGGRVQMFKSTNQGTNWSQMGTLSGSSSITEFAIAPSNSNVLYVIQGGTILWKTTNGGTSWTNITGTLPVGSAQMTFVAIENDDPNSVWVTFSGYSSGNKVYKSTDGGTSWTNYSTGLPNLPANCITYWNGTKDGLYVGCDVGVYYRDSTQASWSLYNTGLPNVSVHDLAIFYPSGKIRAATYGRGLWEADLVNNGTQAPIANFVADKTNICSGMTVNFTDLSTFAPTSWSWVFQSGTPATSTAQNPSVVYNTPGTYSVQLTATNANGNNTATKTLYITVSGVNTLPLVEGFQGATFPPANWQNLDDKTDGMIWQKNSSVGKGSTASMYFDNYNQDATNSRDEMRTPKYNFSGFSTVKMYFDVAYAQYDATYSDSLAVLVSSNCGVSWNQVYVKGGTTLATAPNYTAAIFTPTSTQWRTDTIYLNSYAGQGNVAVSFQNRGHYGQAIYIDNINITGSGSAAVPNATFSVSTTKCTGQAITFTDHSTNNPTSWSWTFTGGSPSTSTVQNPTVTYTAAGTYTATLVATNATGSSTPSTQTITVAATPTVNATAGSGTICAGQSTVLTGSGAANYTWTPGGATTSTISVSPSSNTTYTVTGYTSGCASTKTITINVNATPTVTATAASGTICSGQSTVLTGSGATSYTWAPGGATTSTISVSPSSNTTYTVTGSTGGCANSKTITVNVNATPTVNATASSGTICSGQSAVLTGSGATSYTWSPGGATTSTVSVSPASNTTYTVTGNTAGCVNTKTVAVTVNASPTVNATASSGTICSGQNTILTGSGATNYTWAPGGVTTSTVSVSPASNTTYTVTGSTGGCVNTKTVAVTVNATPTVNATASSGTICAGQSTVLTGSGATNYTWAPGGAITSTVSVSPGTNATYTVTGATGACSASKTVSVSVSPNPTITVNPATICSGNTATLSANGASTYTWNTGANGASLSVSPSSTTVYTVSGTSAGCVGSATSTVNVNATPTVNVNSSTLCSGNSTTLTASGASTYSWSPSTGLSATSGSVVTANPSNTTVYTVTGTTGTCSGSGSSTVTVVANLTVTVNSVAICSGSAATLTASGASSYTWNSGSNNASINVSPTSTTVYTVTGSSGSCSSSNTATVTVNSLPSVSASSSGTICAGSSASLNSTGAISYTWNPGGMTGASVNVSPGSTTTYTVSGNDGTCTNTATTTVGVNNLPNITVTAVQDTICIGNSTSMSASGGVSYTWSPSTGLNTTTGANVAANPTVTTSYTVTATDNNGCTNSAVHIITVNGCTGLNNAAGFQLNVYPNPNHGTFTIELPATAPGVYTIEIRNVLTQLVYADKIEPGKEGKKTVSLAQQNKGIYTLEISGGTEKKIYRLIIE